MLTETGRVVAIEPDCLWVETVSTSACGNCAAKPGCGQGLLNRWAMKNAYLKLSLDGRDPHSFSLGDSVSIGVSEDVVLKSSLLIYCLPLLAMMAGGGLGQIGLGSEGAAMLGSLLGLIAGGLLVKLFTGQMQRRQRLQPVLLELLASDPVPAISTGPSISN